MTSRKSALPISVTSLPDIRCATVLLGFIGQNLLCAVDERIAAYDRLVAQLARRA
jgi:hypothetical protein